MLLPNLPCHALYRVRVIAYEPVPIFRAFFTYSVYLNDLSSMIDIRPLVVGWKAAHTHTHAGPCSLCFWIDSHTHTAVVGHWLDTWATVAVGGYCGPVENDCTPCI